MLRKLFVLPLLWCTFMITVCSTVAAGAAEPRTKEVQDKAVIFVLDASNSMNSNDKNRLAIDSIAQLIYSLPSDYLTGVVAYNNQVVCATELVDAAGRAAVMQEAAQISYKSYTNAGEGLARAVELLKGMEATQKTIVILSDGEIYMQTPEETTASSELFQAAVTSAAEQKIQIHVIGLGEEMTGPETNIFSAAHDTGGTRIQISQAEDIPKAIETILVEHLHIKKSTAAIMNASGETDSITIPLPFRNAGKVRILLTSTGTIQNLITNFHASDAKQINGTYYSLVEITDPSVEIINIQLKGEAGSQVKADILPEYTIAPRPEVLSAEYQAEGPTAMQLRIQFYDARNPNVQLFTESIFENIPVDVTIDGNVIPTVLAGGALQLSYELTESRTLPFQFNYSGLPANVLGSDTANLEVVLEPPPPEPDLRPWIIGGIVIVLSLIALLILFLRRPKKIIPLPSETPSFSSRHSYTGKFSIFITKTASGHDIPPLTFNLFRLPSDRDISLHEVLDACGVDESFEGAEKILFQPGANRSLILTNHSDCTILRNREILMKRKSYELPLNSKVDITFENERSELVLQYRELGPSERRAS